ncbi:MAG: hypothetical protein CL403_07040 [Acidimicrobiaceae bacterium]|nr:hypothetical protein [Acidimicrobiaceae bacterium]
MTTLRSSLLRFPRSPPRSATAGRRPDSCGRPRLPADAPSRARRHVGRPSGDWDYPPRRDATEEYVRNHMDWTVAAATTRFPPIAGATGRS